MEKLLDQDVAWAVRRMPQQVSALLKSGSRLFVAGGFVRACIANETVNDLDLFAPSKESAQAAANAIASNRQVHSTDNAFTVRLGELPVQFIHRWTFDTPEACCRSFDFTIACAAIWHDGTKWDSYCDPRFYADLAARRLIYRSPERNEDAGGSILRVLKFYQRGYRITLPSLGAVVARLMKGVDFYKLERREGEPWEARLASVLTGLLVEVDPNAIIGDESIHEDT